MEEFVGLDVSLKLTHVCVLDDSGKRVWQGTCLSTPESMAETIRIRAPNATRIGLESGPLSTWHWHALNEIGLPILCLDARHVKAALKLQANKTDKNDAYGIAQVVRSGWYREVAVKSLDNHKVRALLGARKKLVGTKTDIINAARGVMKTFGIVLPKSGLSFEEKLEQLCQGTEMLHITLQAFLATLRTVTKHLAGLDKKVLAYAKQNDACRQLISIPGVGPITAVAFVSAIDDPARFRKSRNVGAYFGLTPKRYQSGETDNQGRITKWGDTLVRAYLYEAANSLLIRTKTWCALKVWGLKLAKRSGMTKARVAVARKLAVIMHRMLITGETFRWSNAAEATV
jgi:transposase